MREENIVNKSRPPNVGLSSLFPLFEYDPMQLREFYFLSWNNRVPLGPKSNFADQRTLAMHGGDPDAIETVFPIFSLAPWFSHKHSLSRLLSNEL